MRIEMSGIGGRRGSWDTRANMGIELSGMGGKREAMGYWSEHGD